MTALYRASRPEIAVVIMIVVFMVVYFADEIFYTIPPGSVGVLWLRFVGGTVLTRYVESEGLHVIAAVGQNLCIYDTRLQQLEQDFDVLSADGLKMTVNIAYRFQAIPRPTVPALHQYVGLIHASRSCWTTGNRRARDVYSRATRPKEIFPTAASRFSRKSCATCRPTCARRSARWPAIRSISCGWTTSADLRHSPCSPDVEAAINRKEEQKCFNQEYDYRCCAKPRKPSASGSRRKAFANSRTSCRAGTPPRQLSALERHRGDARVGAVEQRQGGYA